MSLFSVSSVLPLDWLILLPAYKKVLVAPTLKCKASTDLASFQLLSPFLCSPSHHIGHSLPLIPSILFESSLLSLLSPKLMEAVLSLAASMMPNPMVVHLSSCFPPFSGIQQGWPLKNHPPMSVAAPRSGFLPAF